MDPLVILLRLTHIIAGALWVGMFTFATALLAPVLREAGPPAGAVMAGLARRGLMTIMPVLAIFTLVSGFWLYGRAGSYDTAWFNSRPGMVFGLGGLLATLAFILGLTIVRPSMMKAGALAQRLQGADATERTALEPELERLRNRGASWGKLVLVLLLVTLALMAVGRSV